MTPTPEEIAAALERGRLLFAGRCDFFHAAQRVDDLPAAGLPEIALAGRSNVGKSSLINALVGQNALARVSSTPGRTKQLNFFNLADQLVLVDMPGYGFAKASLAVVEDWQGMMFTYLRARPTLRRVMLLMDARIEVKANDLAAMDLLDKAAVIYQIVLTKCDAVKPPALAKKLAEVQALARKHPAAHPDVLTSSSETGAGIAELRAVLAGLT